MTPQDATRFPALSSRMTIRDVELRNRIVFQPHFTALPTIEGAPSEDLIAYHVERAWGGAGLIIDGSMAVMEEGKESRRWLAIYEDRAVEGYRGMTTRVHELGAKIFGQLGHAGNTSIEHPPPILWAPTQMPEPYTNFTTKAMDERDIRRTVEAFARSAANLVAAGFDGIEVKIAHDGLLRAFAAPFSNRRTDKYGGSLENNMRFPMECLQAIRDAVGPAVPLGIRLCLHEYTPFGYDLEYGVRMAAHLESSGIVDYFNTDAGTFSSFWMQIPPAAVPQGHFRPLIQALKDRTDLPVVAFGRIKRPELAEQIIAAGQADLIGMARQLISDPETPRKIVEGRPQEIRACIACNDGCLHQVAQEKGIRCVQNPSAGLERFWSERLLRPTDKPKDLVVVGGGPAGMKVAEIAARRGHHVTLIERDGRLGGQVRLAARQPYHDEISDVADYLEGALERLQVDVRLNTQADAEMLLQRRPEGIIVTTGSQPNLPPEHHQSRIDPDAGAVGRVRGLHAHVPIAGLDQEHVFSSDQVLRGSELPGERVLVVDGNGHWEALGTAEFLADAGYRVEIATNRANVGIDLESTNLALFIQRAVAKNITFTPLTELIAVESGRVRLKESLTGRERWVEVDAIVPVHPRRSRDDLYFELKDRLGDADDVLVERLGDAAAPRLIQLVLSECHRFAAFV